MVFAQAPYRLTPCFNKRSLHLMRFGIKVTGANILNWSLSNFDNAVIGRAFGSGALGLYSRAFNTVSTPAEAVVGTWQQVLFASCSRAGKRTPALRRAYLASLSAITLIMFPVFWSVAAFAPTVVAALYGSLWTGVTPLLPPLAVAITVNAAMALAGPVLGAVDLVKYRAKSAADFPHGSCRGVPRRRALFRRRGGMDCIRRLLCTVLCGNAADAAIIGSWLDARPESDTRLNYHRLSHGVHGLGN